MYHPLPPFKHSAAIGLAEPIDKPLFRPGSDGEPSACNSTATSSAVTTSSRAATSVSSSLPAAEKPVLNARYTCKVPIVGHVDSSTATVSWAKPDKKASPLELAASVEWPQGTVQHELELCLLEGGSDPTKLTAADLAKAGGWQLRYQGQDSNCKVSVSGPRWLVGYNWAPGLCVL